MQGILPSVFPALYDGFPAGFFPNQRTSVSVSAAIFLLTVIGSLSSSISAQRTLPLP